MDELTSDQIPPFNTPKAELSGDALSLLGRAWQRSGSGASVQIPSDLREAAAELKQVIRSQVATGAPVEMDKGGHTMRMPKGVLAAARKLFDVTAPENESLETAPRAKRGGFRDHVDGPRSMEDWQRDARDGGYDGRF